MQSSGVELNEFQVFNGGAGLPGQRYALTGCLGGIGGVGVEVAASSGGQHDSSRPNPVQQGPIQNLHAAAATVFHPELADAHASPVEQTFALLHSLPQYIDQGSPCLVLHMQHPVMTVGSLKGGRQAAVTVAIECHADLKQSLDALRGVVHQQAYCIAVTQPCPGLECVCGMASGAVVRARY